MSSKIKKIVISALMASLTCVATMIVKIPSPLKGYINLGDCIVLLTGWTLLPGYAFAAAGLGSALADVLSGYVLYAPVTFFIKGAMAIVVFLCFRFMQKKVGKLASQVIGGVLAEILMILGYFIFEGCLYGFVPSLVNIPSNAIQGGAGIIIGIILMKIFEKANVTL